MSCQLSWQGESKCMSLRHSHQERTRWKQKVECLEEEVCVTLCNEIPKQNILSLFAYLSVSVFHSLVPIYLFCICSLSPSLYLWSIYLLSLFCICLLSLLVVDWLCSDCSLVDPLHLCTFCIGLLSFLAADLLSLLYIQLETFLFLDSQPPKTALKNGRQQSLGPLKVW